MTATPRRRSFLSIDKMDQKILSSLQTDAMIGDVTLAQRVHLSPSAVGRRRQRLIERGVIQGSQLVLDMDQLGLATTVVTLVQLDQHDPMALTDFEQFVRDRMPFVIEILPLLGSWDYLLRVVAFDNTHYGELKVRITSHKGVNRVRSLTALGHAWSRKLPLDQLPTSSVKRDRRADA
jgi:DNA-binding Lrp family transcriptional regulator